MADDNGSVHHHRVAIATDAVERLLRNHVRGSAGHCDDLVALLSASAIVLHFHLDTLEADAIWFDIEDRLVKNGSDLEDEAAYLLRMIRHRLHDFEER